MSENEVTLSAELSIGGGIIPAQAKIASSVAHRFAARGAEVLQPSRDTMGVDALNARLEASEEVDALVARAVVACGNSANAAKKVLLARVVQRAVLDDAEIDQSLLLVDILDQIDGPHIRCLEDIYRAEQRARISGELGEIARGAEKPITREVSTVAGKYPETILRRLESLGLITGSINWDGMAVIAGTTSTGESILQELHDVQLW